MSRLYSLIAEIIDTDLLPGPRGTGGGADYFFNHIRREGYEGPDTFALIGSGFFGIREIAGNHLKEKGFAVVYGERFEDAAGHEYVVNVSDFFRLNIKGRIRERKIMGSLLKKASCPDRILAESLN